MTIVRRIRPLSAFKVGLVIYWLIGLVLGTLCTLASLASVVFVRAAHVAIFGGAGVYIGMAAIVLCPVVYGLIGGGFAALGALLYNVASSWFGGLELETSADNKSAARAA